MTSLQDNMLRAIDDLSSSLASIRSSAVGHEDVVEQLTLHLAALRHHVARDPSAPRVVVVLGGTGTGKSTLVNRLLEVEVSATSFRRTFTAGAVAALAPSVELPDGFAGLPSVVEPEPPTRGTSGRLTLVRVDAPLLQSLILIDSPDLDGAVLDHHATAERLFRFTDIALFVTTPEKYQMTEMWPFYKLADRYAVPSLFVINKLDEPGPAEDFERQLREKLGVAPQLFQVPRDDSLHAVEPSRSLDRLRAKLLDLPRDKDDARHAGQRCRAEDLAGRIKEKLHSPLENRRFEIESVLARLRKMNAPAGHVDVGGVATELRQRFDEKSVLYLLGPRRMLERARKIPGLLARFPRPTWDVLTGGKSSDSDATPSNQQAAPLPDFRQILIDRFRKYHATLDELMRPFDVKAGIADRAATGAWKMDIEAAGAIADGELAELKSWLAQRWDAEPRDTQMVRKLLGKLPGGDRLVSLSEAAPYLLTVGCVVKGAVFGPVDLTILGGYMVLTWLLERLSSEVRAKVRDTNMRIEERFKILVETQSERAARWLDHQAPDRSKLEELRRQTEQLIKAFADDGRSS